MLARVNHCASRLWHASYGKSVQFGVLKRVVAGTPIDCPKLIISNFLWSRRAYVVLPDANARGRKSMVLRSSNAKEQSENVRLSTTLQHENQRTRSPHRTKGQLEEHIALT